MLPWMIFFTRHVLVTLMQVLIQRRYNEERDNPELPRNMPPAAGRIMWIRFCFKTIKGPMEEFKKHDEVINHMVGTFYYKYAIRNERFTHSRFLFHGFQNTQRCIKLFNVLSIVFTEFELIYYKAWCENVGQVSDNIMY